MYNQNVKIIKVDPDVQSECEKEGYKFGYSCFEELPPAEVFKWKRE